MGLFGGDNDKNKFQFGRKGEEKTLYTTVDSETGEITIYEDKGFDTLGRDIKLGTIKPGEKFVPHEGSLLGGLYPDGYSDVFVGENAKYFQSDKGLKELRSQAEKTARLGCEEASDGNTPEACAKRASELIKNGKATTDPTDTAEEVAQANLDNTNIKPVAGTRNKAGSFGDLKYPKDMNGSQDFMMFTLLEYKPKDLLSGDSLGTGERARVGFNKDGGGRKILGTCSLPIQSGIKDTNSADWGENRMNAMQLATAEIALGATEGTDAAGGALDKVAKVMGENSGVAKEAIQQFFAGKMTGTTGLFARTKGATINPNLELLFNGPQLRPFSFQFKLSPRNKIEAQEVVRIIRFFKQGMSPIRTEGNLFLLAPHTFQVHFVHAPTSAEHPFIGKMKECALKTFSTDYTPENNYSTLKDGFMASYSITMEFQELEPVYNDDYRDDEDSGFSSFREDPAENAALQNTLPAKIGF